MDEWIGSGGRALRGLGLLACKTLGRFFGRLYRQMPLGRQCSKKSGARDGLRMSLCLSVRFPAAPEGFSRFLNFFANNPKVPGKCAVKGTEGSKGWLKDFQKYFSNTLKFSEAPPLKVQKGRKQGEKKVTTTLKFCFSLT